MITTLPCKIVGMSNEEYHSLSEFDNRSLIHAVKKGGGEAQLWLDKGRRLFNGNAATAKGSEFDDIVTGMLNGKSFDDLVVVPPADVLDSTGGRRGNAYKAWAAEQTGVICTFEQMSQYRTMVDSMMGNDAVHRTCWAPTVETQPSVFFELDGHKLRCRPDACTQALWWDLKTTSMPWDRIYRSVIDYGYDMQEALYVAGAEALGMETFRMPFVFVQTMPPYACRAFLLPEEMVANARARLRSVLEQIRLRRSTGMYMPEESREIVELEIPQWALREEEEVVL